VEEEEEVEVTVQGRGFKEKSWRGRKEG